ncbi:MAG TPA: hypothetical protein VMP67_02690 [Candidatus Limnocylindria bacterium]|nr:hypothetical protein [Candidatus Limnocylindria bacterium]
MRMRESWSALLAGAATIWLLVTLWLTLADGLRGVDGVAIALAFALQLPLLMAWDLYPRLPLWIVAGHGLIMVSLAVGLLITAPAGSSPTLAGVPWHVVGLVPAGVAMMVAAGLRVRRTEGFAH